ncbi:MAG TPA: cytochrome c maturation protein CcmE [Lysobacter sp.]|nr:cytochrome c maturation protein CcmE [Lysobacter sp.]
MNPIRRRRMLWILALVVGAGLAASLVAMALQRNVAYLYTPSEVFGGQAGAQVRGGDTKFRLGGMVAGGSFKRAEGSMEAHFTVTDGDRVMPVVYTGILPDLFRENQAVIATGRMQGDRFVAEEVLAKHDETYMPKEVADKMGKAHKKHDVADDTAAGGAPADAAALPVGASQ